MRRPPDRGLTLALSDVPNKASSRSGHSVYRVIRRRLPRRRSRFGRGDRARRLPPGAGGGTLASAGAQTRRLEPDALLSLAAELTNPDIGGNRDGGTECPPRRWAPRDSLHDVNLDRKVPICWDRKIPTSGASSFPQARCWGVGLDGAVGNWLGAATGDESGGDKPVIHSGPAAPSPVWLAAITRPSCGGGPRWAAAGSDDPASCRSFPGC